MTGRAPQTFAYLVVAGVAEDAGGGVGQHVEGIGVDPSGRWWSVVRMPRWSGAPAGWTRDPARLPVGVPALAAFARRGPALAMLEHLCEP